jgi:hypothetical protein
VEKASCVEIHAWDGIAAPGYVDEVGVLVAIHDRNTFVKLASAVEWPRDPHLAGAIDV